MSFLPFNCPYCSNLIGVNEVYKYKCYSCYGKPEFSTNLSYQLIFFSFSLYLETGAELQCEITYDKYENEIDIEYDGKLLTFPAPEPLTSFNLYSIINRLFKLKSFT